MWMSSWFRSWFWRLQFLTHGTGLQALFPDTAATALYGDALAIVEFVATFGKLWEAPSLSLQQLQQAVESPVDHPALGQLYNTLLSCVLLDQVATCPPLITPVGCCWSSFNCSCVGMVLHPCVSGRDQGFGTAIGSCGLWQWADLLGHSMPSCLRRVQIFPTLDCA